MSGHGVNIDYGPGELTARLAEVMHLLIETVPLPSVGRTALAYISGSHPDLVEQALLGAAHSWNLHLELGCPPRCPDRT